jgi:hypothetical protein
MKQTFNKVVVEFYIAETAQEDEFTLTSNLAKSMIKKELPWAYDYELDAKVIKSQKIEIELNKPEEILGF